VRATTRDWREAVNPRRMVVEDRALTLADDLATQGQVGLAARLRGTVPDSLGQGDEHVPLLREALEAVAQSAPAHKDAADRVLAALDDLPRFIGRRGRVFLGARMDGTFSAYWEEDDWLEQGPTKAPLEVALAWAERRSDDVRRNDT
jgi:hypothetical protein